MSVPSLYEAKQDGELFFLAISKQGKKKTVKKNETNIPVPAIIPNWATPWKDVNAKLKNPIAVANAVKNNAFTMLLVEFINKRLECSLFFLKNSKNLKQ